MSDTTDTDHLDDTEEVQDDLKDLRTAGTVQALSAVLGGACGLPVWWVLTTLRQLGASGHQQYPSHLLVWLVVAITANICAGMALYAAGDPTSTTERRQEVAWTLSILAWMGGLIAIIAACCAL